MKTLIRFLPSMHWRRGLLVAAVLTVAACAGNLPPADRPVPDGHYRVQRGDTLYRISLRFGQSAATLAAWNRLADPGQIEVGQVLRVRANCGRPAGQCCPATTAAPSRPMPTTIPCA